ncbi:hypothetical protein SLEP1_g60393, partial [Rubroshorea leprosula]
MGVWREDTWQWTLHWRRSLYEWEKDNLTEMLGLINNLHPIKDQTDHWEWKHNKEGEYSVKTAYGLLSNNIDNSRTQMHKGTWSKLIPTKISAFGWQVLQNKIPTKLNLYQRGIIPDNSLMCGLCDDDIEDTNHLFIHCRVAHSVRSKCARWWRFLTAHPKSCQEDFEQHRSPIKDSSVQAGWDV